MILGKIFAWINVVPNMAGGVIKEQNLQKAVNKNMEMHFEIEEEYKQFLEDIKNSSFVFGAYMDETEYEDEYSHNAINEAMKILQEKIREHLHDNRPGEFIVCTSWCVHVMTPERARQSRVSERTIELRLVR